MRNPTYSNILILFMKRPLFKESPLRVHSPLLKLTEQFLVLCPSSQHAHPLLLYYYFIFFLLSLHFDERIVVGGNPTPQSSKFWPKLFSPNYSHYWQGFLSPTTVNLIPASGNKDFPVSIRVSVFGSTAHLLIFVKVTSLNFANKRIIPYWIPL